MAVDFNIIQLMNAVSSPKDMILNISFEHFMLFLWIEEVLFGYGSTQKNSFRSEVFLLLLMQQQLATIGAWPIVYHIQWKLES